MKKKFIWIINLIILCIFILGLTKVMPIISSGYKMYQNAVKENSVESVVDKIKEKEGYFTLDTIPKDYIEELLQSEDKRFYYHFGLDPIATTRAMYNNIKAGSYVQGGSTITQQLAKNMYFSFEKKLDRKVAEVFVAFELERNYSKDDILELYLNVIYFGEGCYGVKEAANHYYGVEPQYLNEEQIGELVFTIKSPNNYNPNVYGGEGV
ncbi:biosynthetic peptidoglycan transglycosylase [Lachnoclostridium phytofermentans]|uniref:biosynthetic peptidoglycan transglycosylase n=1 Tax=Lachnoclostridium phytofermentans TaxID=66219 RepID=UPI000495113A|nr:biosynthetic peptidoglycan transglycosylase [Lachnoclostridium phytofermentans]